MEPLSVAEFERQVSNALDRIDPGLADLMSNVAVFVEDRHRGEPDLLGLYEGIPLTERDSYGMLELPDRVIIYRLALCAACKDVEQLVDEIHITVVHEVAHHFGIDDDRLHQLGWG